MEGVVEEEVVEAEPEAELETELEVKDVVEGELEAGEEGEEAEEAEEAAAETPVGDVEDAREEVRAVKGAPEVEAEVAEARARWTGREAHRGLFLRPRGEEGESEFEVS